MNPRSAARRGTPTRHGRRPMRSSMTGPALPNPTSRMKRFEADARGVVEYLQRMFPDELRDVQIGFQTVPTDEPASQRRWGPRTKAPQSPYFAVDRKARTIMLFRMPIQRSNALHVNDDEHRRYFVEHCVYLAVCEYLGREPWELLPGRFDHY